jgi:hypothetical protein
MKMKNKRKARGEEEPEEENLPQPMLAQPTTVANMLIAANEARRAGSLHFHTIEWLKMLGP